MSLTIKMSHQPDTKSTLSRCRAFVVAHAVPTLFLSALVVTTLTASIIAGVLTASPRPNWPAFVATTTITALVAVISTIPLALCVNSSLMTALTGYFVSAAVRVVGMLAGIAAAMFAFHVPGQTMVVMIVFYYFALLLSECGIVSLTMWNRSA